jgi:hypothetical protein
VAAAQVLHKRVTGRDRASRGKPFQAAHRTQSGFKPTVISFHDVVGVPLGDVPRCWHEFPLLDNAR